MCGIVGIYLKTKKFEKNLGKMLSGMLNNMESRGPDSAGFAIYKNSEKKEYKYSLCINSLDFSEFKKNISKKIKNFKINQYSDHVIVKTTEIPKNLFFSTGLSFECFKSMPFRCNPENLLIKLLP